MKLFYATTFNPRKACAVARHLDAPVTFVHVDLLKGEHRSPDYLAVNPNGRVPALIDGDTMLWEADAIMCHLARKAGSELWPSDGAQQVEVMRWLSWNSQHFSSHTGNLYFEHLIKPVLGLGEPEPAAVERMIGAFRDSAAVLNGHLRTHRYAAGDDITIADFALASGLPYADDTHVPFADFPHIVRWYTQLDALPAWRDPYPARTAA
ncbi:glutathione S-transferase family protein [Bradyrhizobium sp. U87765 SZCCT0131]|uniref:glutathione S-transferase family protein n=1 Tax=unclassified Bradyrhizobium TaxID=2631580 RepID=UPI001BA62020|nr:MULTISPECIES: glutathione S-transferase family protein [unclassified Bradyrhizobium]MBR1220733.1 glutathione S-transferase family protein [Bradyrhizobium sp. U87765 SZCCT0131]MBR1260447.1 glutathione S-transferase family protein [Bradyrhizobium sp. U87765 SZCCT0134]MBR1307304.1 glutathione S-transferase family protein [Bradyrhizobium sp. U87765 SZCCT0110]MBR1321258.1 glutathione S-transferase family protein [Bradyrhizobium sp. U87765 SZCCT0109]MBR1349571.1 glutathione S-transferase family p